MQNNYILLYEIKENLFFILSSREFSLKLEIFNNKYSMKKSIWAELTFLFLLGSFLNSLLSCIGGSKPNININRTKHELNFEFRNLT